MLVAEMVGKHADRLDAIADGMERDGIGGDLRNGHRLFLKRMASSMRAEAAAGRVPSTYNANADIYASAERPPLPAVVQHLMASNGIDLEGGQITIGALDAAMTDATISDRFALQTALARAGRIASA
jgi:hypothetical protein